MCYQIATIDGINAANTTSACALARTEITWYSESLAALEYNHARYVAAIHYAQQKHSGQRRRLLAVSAHPTQRNEASGGGTPARPIRG